MLSAMFYLPYPQFIAESRGALSEVPCRAAAEIRICGKYSQSSILLLPTTSTKSSLPIGLAELWESEPIGTCKNNNPIHDQGCGYNYLDDRPSK